MVEHPPLESLWQEPRYTGHRWGMTIDLSKCIGCGACVVACQAENNIPDRGQGPACSAAGRCNGCAIDRYFRGAPDQPQVVFQPVACQQCELAPCEEVCPVAATVHSKEGLNDMVYNRCIGTRYCSNNCPYKVRRFNFFNYHKELEDPANEVRQDGLQPRGDGPQPRRDGEVHLLRAADPEREDRRPRTSAARSPTARSRPPASRSVPTQAIIFGDLADPQSAVAQRGGRPAGLRHAGRVEHPAANVVPGQDPQSQSRAGRR